MSSTSSNTRTNRQGLKLAHLNIFHLLNKVPELCVFMNQSTPFHLFGLSETRLHPTVSDESIAIPGYSVTRRDPSKNQQTGLAVYIHESIQSITRRRDDLESEDVESVWIEIRVPHSSPLFVCYLYRNPASSFIWYDEFVKMMDRVSNISSNIVLLGDFNIDLYKHHPAWSYTTTLFGLHQLVQSPTRVTPKSSTLIDHVYTTKPDSVLFTDVPILSISDHYPVVCTLSHRVPKIKRNQHSYISYRSFKNFNEALFLSDLDAAPFSDIFNLTDPNKALSLWYKLLLEALNKHAPVRHKRVRRPSLPPWLTEELKQAMAQRDRLRKDKNFADYKRQRNKVKHLVRKAKRAYFKKLVDEENSTSSIWRALRSITQSTNSTDIPSCLSPDKFNTHFLSVADTLGASSNNYTCSKALHSFCDEKIPPRESFTIPPIAVHEVGKYVSKISNKKSTGTDGVSGYILKLSLPYTIETLTYIYNLCIQKNVFPAQLKIAKVVPLPKTKDLSDPNNFRPISILSVISKPIEKHIHASLLSYLEKWSLLHPLQSGFRPHHSCHTALARITNMWLNGLNNSNMTGAVFLDLRKAFDLINHDILLKKLFVYFRDVNSVSFLRSYLENRLQRVYVHGKFSSDGVLKFGVPQGSVLGPLLFCIFMNDLPLEITPSSVSCDMFADDTTLHAAGKTVHQIQQNLQQGVDDVFNWCSDNCMLIHPSKTKTMLIATRQKHQISPLCLNVSLGSTSIEQVSQHRLLGIIIDDQLKWQAHTENLCKKLSKNLFLLSKLKHFVDLDTRKLFFNAHIKPHVDYASTVWDQCSQNHFQKVDSLYRRSCKLILPDPTLTTDQKLEKLGILPLQKHMSFNKGVFMHKILHNKAPSYLCSLFSHAQSRYETSRSNLRIPRPRIDLYKTSLSFAGASLWNSLPTGIQQISSVSSFKTKLLKHVST